MTRNALATAVLATLLTACGGEPAPTTSVDAGTTASASASESADADAQIDGHAAVWLSSVFIDSDPQLMAGARLVRGRLRVGDQLQLWTERGGPHPVTLTEITDNTSNARVDELSAPADAFLLFKAEQAGLAGSENVLIAAGTFNDFASAQAFIKIGLPKEESEAPPEPRFGEASFQLGDLSMRAVDPAVMLRRGVASSSNLLDYISPDGSRSPTRASNDTTAQREVSTLASDTPVMFSIQMALEEADGTLMSIDLSTPAKSLADWSKLPVELHYEGTPSLLPPPDQLAAWLRHGTTWYDARQASLRITQFDAARGVFEGEFELSLLERPADLVKGSYRDATAVEVQSGRFRVALEPATP